MAYPQFDKFQIQMIVDFDEIMRKKYGDDYDVHEHLDEIFPEDIVKPQDGQGEDSKASA